MSGKPSAWVAETREPGKEWVIDAVLEESEVGAYEEQERGIHEDCPHITYEWRVTECYTLPEAAKVLAERIEDEWMGSTPDELLDWLRAIGEDE